MSNEKLVTRREALSHGALGIVALALVPACKDKEFTCTDVSALPAADAQARAALSYVDRTLEAGKTCSTCQQFEPAKEGCGTCKVVKGPIHPQGNCKAYLAKT